MYGAELYQYVFPLSKMISEQPPQNTSVLYIYGLTYMLPVLFCFTFVQRRDSVVGRLRSRRPRNCGSIPGRGQVFASLPVFGPALGPTQPLTFFLGVRRSGLESKQSSSFSAEVEEEWGYVPTPSICLYGADRDSFVFRYFLKYGLWLIFFECNLNLSHSNHFVILEFQYLKHVLRYLTL